MENLRWILVLVGVLIIVGMYIQAARKRRQSQGAMISEEADRDDPLFNDPEVVGMFDEQESPAADSPESDPDDPADHFDQMQAAAEREVIDQPQGRITATIAEKIESLSVIVLARRKEREALRAAESTETDDTEVAEDEQRIVALNVVAAPNRKFSGKLLNEVFRQRGYEHGDMQIYHSRYKNRTVFSVANIVSPGTFDADKMNVFTTPGIVMFLELPSSIAPDVAFEVLLSEAKDIAHSLGGTLQDSDRCNLSNQQIQHLREEVQDYMMRHKLLRTYA